MVDKFVKPGSMITTRTLMQIRFVYNLKASDNYIHLLFLLARIMYTAKYSQDKKQIVI